MFKSIFLSDLFIWIRLFIDGGSMGFIAYPKKRFNGVH